MLIDHFLLHVIRRWWGQTSIPAVAFGRLSVACSPIRMRNKDPDKSCSAIVQTCLQAAISQLSLLVHTLPTEQLTPEAAAALEQFTGGPASAGGQNFPSLVVVSQSGIDLLLLLLAGDKLLHSV